MTWRRAFTEGLVILLSVLAAFMVDRAWDVREAQELEREILLAVEEEVTANLAELSSVLAHGRDGDLRDSAELTALEKSWLLG